MRHVFAASAAAFLLTATTAFADPVGRYSVVGNNPGGGSNIAASSPLRKPARPTA
jgi:hypothetical protein